VIYGSRNYLEKLNVSSVYTPTGSSVLNFSGLNMTAQSPWQGALNSIAFDPAGIQAKLLTLDKPCYVVRYEGQIGVTHEGSSAGTGSIEGVECLGMVAPMPLDQLGDRNFRHFHGLQYAYSSGAMASGIASAELVIALGQVGMLGSFGAGGVVPARLEEAIQKVQQALPNGPYMFNLIHAPVEAALERGAVELFLKYGVKTIEASAFLDLTPYVVRYRVAGLSLNEANQIIIGNKIVAKVSRAEVATKFMQPPPEKMLQQLVADGLITEQQAQLAQYVPMADDITVEADSGGHTDNRPLVSLLPSIINLRDQLQAKYNFANPVRIGAAGGISTPQSALAAYMMGAAYVVTGSVNQSCVEAGTSAYTKKLLAEAEMHDVMMAPAADMFEMGVKLQVLKRGTMFPVRAQKLYDIYRDYDSIEAIPPAERQKIEQQIFRRNLDDVWNETVSFFQQRDPEQIARAADNPKRKMALIFRWYLGLSSRWSSVGDGDRKADFQIWCGPAMGAFNEWVKGTYLEAPENRKAIDVAFHILIGAAYLYRIQALKLQGIEMPSEFMRYVPAPLAYSQG
jgi:trans-AT polyketide synthase, acyltransferase and oxidoreductase domains